MATTAASVLAFSAARSLARERDQQARSDELVEIKAELSWLHHEILVDGVLAYQRTGTANRPDDLDRQLVDRAALVARLDELASTPDSVGRSAAALIETVNAEPITTWPVDLWAIEGLHYETMPRDDGPSAVTDPPAGTVGSPDQVPTTGDLIAAAQTAPLPQFVLLDAVAIDLRSSGEPLPSWAAPFLETVVDTVIANPGWFGPDPAQPLTDHVMAGPGAVTPPLVIAATEPVAASLDLVAEYDRWLIAGATEAGPPPASLDELVVAVDEVAAAIRDAVRTGFEAREAAEAPSVLGLDPILARLLVGGLTGAVTMALTGLGLVWWNRRRRHLADAAYSDPLTGAGNRRYLDEVVADRVRRSGQTHVVVMLDMDRFKLVNDTWGHDAGDALLRALSQRLYRQVDAFCASTPGSTSAVIRLGGDEFAVVVHGPIDLDVEALERWLRSAAGPVDLGRDEPIQLAFSLGLVASRAPGDVADLLKAADLATYEDKERVPTRPPVRPVVDISSVDAG